MGAPELVGAPDLTNVKVDPKPDWYFAWIFAIFALMPRNIGSYVIMLGPVLTITVLLAVPFLSKGGERSPLKRPWAIGAVAFLIITICGLWYIGDVEP